MADAKQEALREMHILLTLSHPNLIQIREVVCNEELDTWCAPHRITQRIPAGPRSPRAHDRMRHAPGRSVMRTRERSPVIDTRG